MSKKNKCNCHRSYGKGHVKDSSDEFCNNQYPCEHLSLQTRHFLTVYKLLHKTLLHCIYGIA